MKLQLTKPIVFFDLETTGVETTKEHIVEICYIKLYPDGREEEENIRVRPVDAFGNTFHIPEQATAVHGITDDDVKGCQTFKEIAPKMKAVFEGCDLAGYNSNYYDIPLLVEEFLRAGVNVDFSSAQCVDVFQIYKKLSPRSLSAAYKNYCNKDLEDAHSANADTRATLDVLEAMLDQHSDELKNNITELANYAGEKKSVDYASKMVYDESGAEIFNFGKHKGKKVVDVLRFEPGYYDWMMRGDFAEETKQQLTKIRLRMLNGK